MGQLDREILGQFAAKYIWWKTPGEALQHADRVIAQVMDIGDYDDVQQLDLDTLRSRARGSGNSAYLRQFAASLRAWPHVKISATTKKTRVPPPAEGPVAGQWPPRKHRFWDLCFAATRTRCDRLAGTTAVPPMPRRYRRRREQYEVGLKTEVFGGRLSSSLAFYQLTKTNLPAPDLSTPDPRDRIAIGEAEASSLISAANRPND